LSTEEALEAKTYGRKRFFEATKKKLGIKTRGRKVLGNNETYQLQEPDEPFGGNFNPENGVLRLENIHSWSDNQ